MEKFTHVVVVKTFNYDGDSVPLEALLTVGKGEDLTRTEALGLLNRKRVRHLTDEELAELAEGEEPETDPKSASKTTDAKTTKK